VLTEAVAVELTPATNATAAAGVAPQAVSFSSVVTGASVADGLTAVPTGDAATVTLPTVTCANVSPPLPKTLEYEIRYRLF
jgi:hypothetical protein